MKRGKRGLPRLMLWPASEGDRPIRKQTEVKGSWEGAEPPVEGGGAGAGGGGAALATEESRMLLTSAASRRWAWPRQAGPYPPWAYESPVCRTPGSDEG